MYGPLLKLLMNLPPGVRLTFETDGPHRCLRIEARAQDSVHCAQVDKVNLQYARDPEIRLGYFIEDAIASVPPRSVFESRRPMSNDHGTNDYYKKPSPNYPEVKE